MLGWFELGLKELGLTKDDYDNLSQKDKQPVDKLLKEMGHLRGGR